MSVLGSLQLKVAWAEVDGKAAEIRKRYPAPSTSTAPPAPVGKSRKGSALSLHTVDGTSHRSGGDGTDAPLALCDAPTETDGRAIVSPVQTGQGQRVADAGLGGAGGGGDSAVATSPIQSPARVADRVGGSEGPGFSSKPRHRNKHGKQAPAGTSLPSLTPPSHGSSSRGDKAAVAATAVVASPPLPRILPSSSR